MKCPKCGQEMKKMAYEGVEIDHCQSCQGNWLDRREITAIIKAREEVFAKDEVAKTIQEKESANLEVKDPANPLTCPQCNVPMKQLSYAYSTGVVIDRCPSCDGIWLDKDELERIQIIMEDEEKRMPELMEKLGPALEQIKQKYEDERAAQIRQIEDSSMIAKIPGMKQLVRFLMGHF